MNNYYEQLLCTTNMIQNIKYYLVLQETEETRVGIYVRKHPTIELLGKQNINYDVV